MATPLWMWEGNASGFLTPNPLAMHQSNESWKTSVEGGQDGGQDVQAYSGFQTPVFVDQLNLEVLQGKLDSLQNDVEHLSATPPPGLVNNDLDSDKVFSKSSQGYPFTCAPACMHASNKVGCDRGKDCHSCHHSSWSESSATASMEEWLPGYQEEDGRLRESRTMADKLVWLVGAEEPFEMQKTQEEAAKLENSLSFWTRSSGQETKTPSFIGASYSEAMKDGRDTGSVFDSIALVSDPYAAPILSTNPISCQTLAFPEPQAMPQMVPWCVSAGSTGHPHTCAPACKYARSAKGCKDGFMCDHCHLCRWVRRGKMQKII